MLMLTSTEALRLPLIIVLQNALARASEQHMSGQPGALHSYQIALDAIDAGLQLDMPDAWLEVTSSHKLSLERDLLGQGSSPSWRRSKCFAFRTHLSQSPKAAVNQPPWHLQTFWSALLSKPLCGRLRW